MSRGHDGGQLAGDVDQGLVTNTRRGGVLAREHRPRVNRLALCVDEGVEFVEGLRRGEPLEGGGRRGGGEDDEYRGVIGERDDEVAAFDWVVGWGESEGELG